MVDMALQLDRCAIVNTAIWQYNITITWRKKMRRYKGWKHEGITGWLWHKLERYSSRLNTWVWQQRWGKRPRA